MKDVLYTSDIPSDYHFVRFGNGYFDLFNEANPNDEIVDFYRVYYSVSPSTYVHLYENYNPNDSIELLDYPVSGDIWQRPDIDKILVSCLCIALFGIFVINIVTSLIKKGGIFGGLL